MKALVALAAALAAASFVTPVAAGGGSPPPGVAAPARAGAGDLGMAVMSAAINADGSVARGEGVRFAIRRGPGLYEVAFGRDIPQCVYNVTVGESGVGNAAPAVAAVRLRSGDPNLLIIDIDDRSEGVGADRGFFVLVYCGR